MKTISIGLTNKESETTEKVIAEFSDEEFRLLEDYLSNTERLLKSKIIKDGMPGNLRINYDKDRGLTCEVNLPEEDEIFALLHLLRRFILQKECSSYNRVTSIVGKKFENSRVRAMLKLQRKIYDGKEFQKGIEIHSNGEMVNSEKMLYDWLNAFEYHNDQTKKAEIEKLHQLMPLDASRAVFLMMLTEKVKAIVAVAQFISLLLGRRDTLETRA